MNGKKERMASGDQRVLTKKVKCSKSLYREKRRGTLFKSTAVLKKREKKVEE